ncbi:DNA-binding anti-repressor SinI [Bacillus sp. SA1-12]|nr:DNA-binding anti-repressor SinI [Bacillus sp. SA1-12]
MLIELIKEKGLDKDWTELFLHALEIGITVEEIIEFFNKDPRPN